MNFKTLLLIFSLFFSFSVLQAQDCPNVTGVVVVSQVIGNGQSNYTLEVSTDISGANTSVLVTITGGLMTVSSCIDGVATQNLMVTTVGNKDLDDLVITYRGSNLNCSAAEYCDGTSQTFSGGIVNPLPVELSDFRATQERFHQVQLEWVTASEENNALFSVEHSLDGRNFSELTKIEGQGTTGVEHYYTFVDKFPESGINYYRLKQIDFDGTFTYSEVISVEVDKNTTKPLVIANSLAKDEITVIFNESPHANATLEVFNAGGILFYQNKIDNETSYLSLDISDYEPGMYFVRVPIGRDFRIERFVKVAQ